MLPTLGLGSDGRGSPHQPDPDSPPEITRLIPVSGQGMMSNSASKVPYGMDTFWLLATGDLIANAGGAGTRTPAAAQSE